MTPEEFCSQVLLEVARLQTLAGQFKEESFAEGYVLGFDDALKGNEFNPEPDVISEDRDDDDGVEIDL